MVVGFDRRFKAFLIYIEERFDMERLDLSDFPIGDKFLPLTGDRLAMYTPVMPWRSGEFQGKSEGYYLRYRVPFSTEACLLSFLDRTTGSAAPDLY